MSLPSFDLPPTLQEYTDLLFSTDQGCESSGLHNIETPPGSTFLEDAVHVDRLSHTSECLCSQVLTLEIALDQAIGRTTDHKSIGCCQSLNSGGNVRCFTKCQLFLTSCSTHVPYNNQPRMHPYTDG